MSKRRNWDQKTFTVYVAFLHEPIIYGQVFNNEIDTSDFIKSKLKILLAILLNSI